MQFVASKIYKSHKQITGNITSRKQEKRELLLWAGKAETNL